MPGESAERKPQVAREARRPELQELSRWVDRVIDRIDGCIAIEKIEEEGS